MNNLKMRCRYDIVRTELCEALKRNTSDEQLLGTLNEITRRRTERQSKLGKLTSVRTVEASANDNKILQELQALRVEVKELRDREKQQSQPTYSKNRVRRKCAACKETNTSYCTHCHLCGSGEHFRRNCPSKMDRQSEN